MLELTKNWEETRSDLKSKLGETIFSTWIAPLKFSATDAQNINLEAPDKFFKDWVEKHYLGIIQEALKNKGLNNLLVKLTAGNSENVSTVLDKTNEQNFKSASPVGCLNLNSRYTFDNFVVGPANRQCSRLFASCS